jgi:hypothetical protein
MDMGLTWKDGVGTMLMAGAVAFTLAVTNGWGWPLLNDARAGVIGVTILGFASCQLVARIGPETRWTNPFLVLTVILGIAALGLVIAGLLLNSVPVLVYLTSIVVAMWLVTTIHHLVEVGPAGRPAIQ